MTATSIFVTTPLAKQRYLATVPAGGVLAVIALIAKTRFDVRARR